MNILFVSSDEIPHEGGKSSHIIDLISTINSGNKNKAYMISQKSLSLFDRLAIKISQRLLVFLRKEFSVIDFSRYLLSRKIKKTINKYSIDVISAQDIFAVGYIVNNLKNITIPPIVLTMHTYFGIEPLLDKDSLDKVYPVYENEIQYLEYVSSIVSVDTRINNHVEETLQSYFPDKNVYLESIQNFTNTSRFNSITIDKKQELREKYDISLNEFVVFCPRRLVEKNGVIHSVRAIKKISDIKKNIKLIVIGNGPQLDNLKKYTQEKNIEDKVIFLGGIPNNEIHEYYQLSDCVVIPSITVNGLQEATSISAIEGMSTALPVIASNIGGLAELIINNKTGILVPEKDDESLAKALIDIMGNDRKYLGVNARKHIIQYNSREYASQFYIDVFKKVVQ